MAEEEQPTLQKSWSKKLANNPYIVAAALIAAGVGAFAGFVGDIDKITSLLSDEEERALLVFESISVTEKDENKVLGEWTLTEAEEKWSLASKSRIEGYFRLSSDAVRSALNTAIAEKRTLLEMRWSAYGDQEVIVQKAKERHLWWKHIEELSSALLSEADEGKERTTEDLKNAKTLDELLDMYSDDRMKDIWYRIADNISRDLAKEIPSPVPPLVVVVRNTGDASATLYGVTYSPLGIHSGGAGAGGVELEPVNEASIKPTSVDWFDTTEAPFENPIVLEAGKIAAVTIHPVVDMDTRISDGSSALHFDIHMNYFDGESKTSLPIVAIRAEDDRHYFAF